MTVFGQELSLTYEPIFEEKGMRCIMVVEDCFNLDGKGLVVVGKSNYAVVAPGVIGDRGQTLE